MRLSLDPTAAGFDYRASGGSQLGPFTSQRPDPAAQGRADDHRHRRAQRRRDDRRAATCAPIRAASPARWRWPAAASTGRSAFAPVNGAQRIEAHLTASNAQHPRRRRRSPSARASSTGRSCSRRAAPRSTGRWSARGLAYGAIDIARLTASGKLVNGSGQVRAAIAGRRGQRVRAGRRWPMSRRTGSA